MKNRDSWDVEKVVARETGLSGDPVQGPDMPVPDGFTLTIRQRRHETGPRTGYLANSSANTEDDDFRSEMRDGDVLHLAVDNANRVWFHADADDTVFEVFVEQ